MIKPIYKLYVSIVQNGPFAKKATSNATNAGTAVDLTASGLEEYTEYYYYVTVSDSHADPVQSGTQGAVRTMCSGANLTCNGPFVEYDDCSACEGTGRDGSVFVVQGAGYDDSRNWCPSCGENAVTMRAWCRECDPGLMNVGGTFNYDKCRSCGWDNFWERIKSHGHLHGTCSRCEGTGKKKEGTPIECEHGESSTHTYCIHGLMEPHEDLTELWQYLERVSKDIATRTDITINNDTERVSGTTEKGEIYNISVGDTFKVRYNNESVLNTVRVLGFKHDDLVEQNVYGKTVQKAGISFEFVDFLTTNSIYRDGNGWATTNIRKDLNGYEASEPSQTGTIGGYAAKLSNSSQIKKVKKDYLPKHYSEELSETPAEDYLWLLSCGEIWSDGYSRTGTNARGLARNSEGSQYKYYKVKTNGISYDTANPELVKKTKNSTSRESWWLRSSEYSLGYPCCTTMSGECSSCSAYNIIGVAPGFSI